MFIIGERINGMFRSVARAIAERDEAVIADRPGARSRPALMPWTSTPGRPRATPSR